MEPKYHGQSPVPSERSRSCTTIFHKARSCLKHYFFTAETPSQAFSQDTLACRLNFMLRNTKIYQKRLRFGLLVTELSQCSGRGTVTLALEFGRNVTLPLLAWKFIISLIAPDYVLLIVEYH